MKSLLRFMLLAVTASTFYSIADAETKEQEWIGVQLANSVVSQALYESCGVDGSKEQAAMLAYAQTVGYSTSELDKIKQNMAQVKQTFIQDLQSRNWKCTPEIKAKLTSDTASITNSFIQERQSLTKWRHPGF